MKKLFLIITLIYLPYLSFSQVHEKEDYIYNIVTFSEDLTKEGFKVNIDNGKSIERLRDKKEKK